MKTRTITHLLAAAIAGVLALASCSDDARDDARPGGQQPLVFTAAVSAPAAAPASRANTARGVWTDGDVVGVEMDGVVKKYIAHAPAGAVATLRPADDANTHYPPAPGQNASVRAWFYGNDGYPWNRKPADWYVSATQTGTDPGSGESRYQRSDFLYAPAHTLAYDPQQQGAALTFYHQTARVEVRLRRAGLVNDGNKADIDVLLGTNPSDIGEILLDATFDPSPIDPAAGQYSGLTADDTKSLNSIVMNPLTAVPAGYACCYEALVIPQDMGGKHFITVYIKSGDGRGEYYYVPAPGEADLQGGYTYTYDITVSEHGTLHVTALAPIAGWTDGGEAGSGTAYEETIDPANPPTISDNRVYLLTGRANDMTLTITGGTPTLILRDINLLTSCIHITGGTPEIRVEGTKNNLYGYDNPPIWLDGDNANVRITGGGADKSRLNLVNSSDSQPHASIGTRGEDGKKANYRCGNIAISGLTLYASAQAVRLNGFGGAAIGTGGGEGNRRCGDITVTDARIIAYPGWGAAAIGFGTAPGAADMTGTTYEMGDITLTNSIMESDIRQGVNGIYPAHIGGGAVMAENYTVGGITIHTDKSGPDFFANFTKGGQPHTDGNDVIVGFPGGAGKWEAMWKSAETKYNNITWSAVPGLP